ncbi:TetR/AcrR family transcriptional regulator [Mesorhizobium sp. CAU 1732]|uniref:TetR/AcrR family transcriptional regulator n=1 Tax=Mesorhizobium sp. CAU 1732 TaxID=3140358 RepID=UPI0032605FBA
MRGDVPDTGPPAISATERIDRRRGKGDANRDAIVAAAADLFWRKGYAQTTLGSVAQAAGIPPGNLFYYFRTKADLAFAVADIFVAETQAMLHDTEHEEAEPRKRLAALVARLARSLRSRVAHGCPIALCVRDFRSSAPEASDRAAEAFTMLIQFMARELGRSGLRPSIALGQSRAALAEWQGGMMLAHAMKDATVLSESFRRMDRLLAGH